MYKQFLDKGWHITYTPPVDRKVTAKDIPSLASNWMPCDVPGDINVALFKNKVVEDPHYDTNAQQLYFVTANDWWYRLEFSLDRICDGKMEMFFETLDGECEVFLNGEKVMESTSAFYPHSFNCRGKLFTEKNILAVRFKSIDRRLKSARYSGQVGWSQRRTHLRKPQFNFGWDWALPVPSLGIGGPVILKYDCEAEIADVNVDAHTDGRVDFTVEVVDTTLEHEFVLEVEVSGHGFSEKKVIPARRLQVCTYIRIDNPKLWFPNGYGDPNVYEYTVRLISLDEVRDVKTGLFGFRDVKVIEEPFTEEAGNGYSFWISVNGIRVFCKGGNWIPTEIWPAVCKKEDLKWYVEKAREANFNMLRVWGGGIYQPDDFYNACDRNGIMVWQDFMFASAGYPLPLMREDIIAEANYQILRLRTHPCITMWCGCNEDCFSWVDRVSGAVSSQNDVQAEEEEPGDEWRYDRLKYDPELYSMILRGLVSKHCHGTPYVESSPQARDGAGNQPNSGNAHISCWKFALFDVVGDMSFRDHFKRVCSFDSEFCIQGPCSEKYLRSFMREENQWPANDAWVYHVQKGHLGIPHYKQTLKIAGRIFGEIDSLQKYTKYGQATHCEMMRAEFESARHDYPNNGGTMMWMFNDCWPTSNWSIIQYDKTPKPSFYAAKRACSAVLPIVFERGGLIDFSVSNHTLSDCSVTVKYGVRTLKGELKLEKTAQILVKAIENAVFDRIKKDDIACSDDEYIFIDAVCDNICLDSVSYFPNMWKDVKFEKSDVDFQLGTVEESDGKFISEITLTADNFIRFAHFTSERGDIEFSDNYFDLPAAKTKKLSLRSNKPFAKEDIQFGDWFDSWE
ncbi:MAG: hypothetical protein PUB34_02130 [Clostridia bacterium]|nr:hypothetical protein [Clostridia bacterium]